MSRIVIMHGHGPQKFATKDGVLSICTCGLSKKFPLCDDSHDLTLDEDKDTLYQYDEAGKRTEVMEADDTCEGCCGGGGCACDDGEKKESQCDCGGKCQCDGECDEKSAKKCECGGECGEDEAECCSGCKHNAGTELADECCAGHGHCHCCEAEDATNHQKTAK